MHNICRRLVVVVLLLVSYAALAVPYPNEIQLRTAIGEVVGLMKAEGLELEILDAQKHRLSLPLMAAGLNLRSGTCQVFFNTHPTNGLTQFFAGIEESDLPVWLNAIAVHEATHCIEQREVYVRKQFTKVLPPDFKFDNLTIQGYLSVVKSGAIETWSEALADIASVLYLRQVAPDQWLKFANGIIAMRRDLAGRWPEHDTSVWLTKLIASNPAPLENQSIFEAAFNLRRQLGRD